MTPLDVYEKIMLALAAACGKEQVAGEFWLPYKALRHEIGVSAMTKSLLFILNHREDRDEFPSVRKIRDVWEKISGNAESPEVIVDRVIGAIRKFGYTSPAEARKFIGETGWAVIKEQGGWRGLCESTRDASLLGLKSQLKRSIQLAIEKEKEYRLIRSIQPKVNKSYFIDA